MSRSYYQPIAGVELSEENIDRLQQMNVWTQLDYRELVNVAIQSLHHDWRSAIAFIRAKEGGYIEGDAELKDISEEAMEVVKYALLSDEERLNRE